MIDYTGSFEKIAKRTLREHLLRRNYNSARTMPAEGANYTHWLKRDDQWGRAFLNRIERLSPKERAEQFQSPANLTFADETTNALIQGFKDNKVMPRDQINKQIAGFEQALQNYKRNQ